MISRFINNRVKNIAFCILLSMTVQLNTFGQEAILEKPLSQPAFTPEIVNRYISIYEYLLEVKLNDQQHTRLQNGVAQYWKENNTDAIRQILSDVKYYGKQEELETLRNSSQQVFVDAFRNDDDTVSKVWIEAFSRAHPERISHAVPKDFAAIVGIWKKTDGLIAEKTYSGERSGVSYTDAETLEINADGKFRHMTVHSHYSGNCSQVEGTTETGTASTNGSKLMLTILSGSGRVTDACSPAFNKCVKLKPRTDHFTWTLRSNINNPEIQTLCLNKSDGTTTCLDKQ